MKNRDLLGEDDPARETEIAIVQTIDHSAAFHGISVESTWISMVANIATRGVGLLNNDDGKAERRQDLE